MIDEKNQLQFAKKDDPEPEKYVTGYANKFLSIGREKGFTQKKLRKPTLKYKLSR